MERLTLAQLREVCAARNLETGGSKSDMLTRLQALSVTYENQEGGLHQSTAHAEGAADVHNLPTTPTHGDTEMTVHMQLELIRAETESLRLVTGSLAKRSRDTAGEGMNGDRLATARRLIPAQGVGAPVVANAQRDNQIGDDQTHGRP